MTDTAQPATVTAESEQFVRDFYLGWVVGDENRPRRRLAAIEAEAVARHREQTRCLTDDEDTSADTIRERWPHVAVDIEDEAAAPALTVERLAAAFAVTIPGWPMYATMTFGEWDRLATAILAALAELDQKG